MAELAELTFLWWPEFLQPDENTSLDEGDNPVAESPVDHSSLSTLVH